MGNRLNNFLAGRNGLDALAKLQLFIGVVLILPSYLLQGVSNGIISSFMDFVSMACLILSAFRVFSRNVQARRLENERFLFKIRKVKYGWKLRRDHFKDRKTWKYFKCPQCKKWLRVPAKKGKVHINCKCGYILYRKT